MTQVETEVEDEADSRLLDSKVTREDITDGKELLNTSVNRKTSPELSGCTSYRFLALAIMLFLVFCDTTSRFGISVAMIGGMVKDNCLSATDKGELCWDSDVKANMLGAYFYALQGFVTAVTRQVGFSRVIGFSLTVNTIIQCSFPQSARYSAVLTIALQVLRVLGGVFLAHNMEFARKWSCGSQGTKFITMVGISLSRKRILTHVGRVDNNIRGLAILFLLHWLSLFHCLPCLHIPCPRQPVKFQVNVC